MMDALNEPHNEFTESLSDTMQSTTDDQTPFFILTDIKHSKICPPYQLLTATNGVEWH